MFKVNKSWFDHKEFKEFMSNEWNSFKVMGSKAFVLKEKFKLIRVRIRWWNINVFGWVDLKVEQDVKSMNILEEQIMQFNKEPTKEEREVRSK